MGFLNKEVELIILPKTQNANNKTIEVKSLNGYDAIREERDEGNTLTVKPPVEQFTKLNKSEYWLITKLIIFISIIYIYLNYGSP